MFPWPKLPLTAILWKEKKMDRNEAKRVAESLLFVSEKPITVDQVKEVLDEIDAREIRSIILELKSEYETLNRSFKIYEIAGGFQMATEPLFAEYVKRFYKTKSKDKLTKPALETLAIIAYRQPITKADMEDIRGVNVDGVLTTLSDRMLIKSLGRKDAPGKPILYGTTKEFLDRFGLNSLNELPKLSEFTEADIDLSEVASNLKKEEIKDSGGEEERYGAGKITRENRPVGFTDNLLAQQQGAIEREDRSPEEKEQ
ncbi:MAG: SMC-Scp complex subunit ScpB [Candidatus Omnitrophota bacterium]